MALGKNFPLLCFSRLFLSPFLVELFGLWQTQLAPWALDNISLVISRALEVFIPSVAQHLCFSYTVVSLLAHGLHPQPLQALLAHPFVLPSADEWIAQTGEINWRNCLGALIQGSSVLWWSRGAHQSLWRAWEQRGSCWDLCPSPVPSISGGWLQDEVEPVHPAGWSFTFHRKW